MTSEDFDSQVRMEHYRSGVQVVREVGIMALRTLITLNSGAFVVLLTFIGNTAAQSKFSVPLTSLKWSMGCFLLGLAFVFIAIAITYVMSQNASPYPTQISWAARSYVVIVTLVTTSAFVAFLAGVAIVIAGVDVAQPASPI